MYDEMTDPEKKGFYRILINKIEVHEDWDNKTDGIIKRDIFNVPIFVNGRKGNEIMLTQNCTVEVVSLLQKMSNTRERTITLDVEMEDYHRIKNRTEVTADATE